MKSNGVARSAELQNKLRNLHLDFARLGEGRCSTPDFDFFSAELGRYLRGNPSRPTGYRTSGERKRGEPCHGGETGGFHGIHEDSSRGGESEGKSDHPFPAFVERIVVSFG